MADEPSWDELFSSQPTISGDQQRRTGTQPDYQPASELAAEPRTVTSNFFDQLASTSATDEPRSRREERAHNSRSSRRPRSASLDRHGIASPRRRRHAGLWVLLSMLAVFALAASVLYSTFQPQLKALFSTADSTDYVGSGTGKVVITITTGQIGGDVATTLKANGVTKTYSAFYSLLLSQVPQVKFTPGSYALKKEMSAQSALTALMDPKNKVSTQLVLPEGITVRGIVAKLSAISASTGISAQQVEAAVADFKAYGLPAEAPSLEGYLFPATYTINPGETAQQVIQSFVKQMFSHLDAQGVAVADRHRVLTLAGLTQKEGGNTADFYKIARVWSNRLAQKMNLESDATVSYGAGSTKMNTTVAQRANASNRYNTYANPGLPIGPISNPGDEAIKATLNPAAGNWLYFVVVNCATAETAFSATSAAHEAAVAQLGAWLKKNPGGCN